MAALQGEVIDPLLIPRNLSSCTLSEADSEANLGLLCKEFGWEGSEAVARCIHWRCVHVCSLFLLLLQCRNKVERISKNHLVNNLVEAFLRANPSKPGV